MSEPDNSAVAARKETNAQRVLAFIVTYKRQHDGCAPMVREIMRGMNFRTPSVVAYYLDLLERRGQIRRVQGEEKAQPGGIMVVGGLWLPPEVQQ